MAMNITGKLFDGKTARAWPVTVVVSAAGLVISGREPHGPRDFWPNAQLQVIQESSSARPLILTMADDPEARLVIASPDDAAALHASLAIRLAPPDRLSISPLALAGWFVAAVVVVAVFAMGIPVIAEAAAPYAPQAWREHLGHYVTRALTAGQRVCTSPAGDAAMDALVLRLTAATPDPAHVRVSVSNTAQVNAFAAPGGMIVVYRGLIDLAETPGELAGVLAHEIGHVVKEHPTAAAIRLLGLTLVAQIVAGREADKVASVAAIYSLTYDRRAELEADHIAADIMRRLGDTEGLTAMFKRLAAQDKGVAGDLSVFFSTHPGWTERMAAVATDAAPAAHEPLLSDSQWRDLKAICATAPKP
jgi:predicted Zn-dependent protease